MREALEQGGRSGSAGADPDRLEAEVTARLGARFTALRWLRLSRLALRDLGDIGARVAAGNPRAADAMIGRIVAALRAVRDHPEAGRGGPGSAAGSALWPPIPDPISARRRLTPFRSSAAAMAPATSSALCAGADYRSAIAR